MIGLWTRIGEIAVERGLADFRVAALQAARQIERGEVARLEDDRLQDLAAGFGAVEVHPAAVLDELGAHLLQHRVGVADVKPDVVEHVTAPPP